jgi:adenylate kinase
MSEQARLYILLGPPASGKGTQAKRLQDILDLPHIASGDLFRDHISRETDLGMKAKKYMDRGDLVPDQLTIDMVSDRLDRKDADQGAILDGFPRTKPQAEALDRMLAGGKKCLAAVFLISVPEDVLVERVCGRRICPICGRSYHVKYDPPEEPGVCDQDGGELYQRKDDRPEAVRQRLAVYREQTQPLIAYYREKDLLHEIDGDQDIDQVTEELRQAVQEIQE